MAIIGTVRALLFLVAYNAVCNGFCTPSSISKQAGVRLRQPRGCRKSNAAIKVSATSYLDTLTTVDNGTAVKLISDNNATPKPRAQYDSMICGGGPAGLLSAIMLSQKYGPSYRIAVCERRSTIPPSPSDDTVWNDIARFYLLGIGFRGQNALRKFGVFDDFVKASVAVNGRFDWQPGMTKKEEGKITPAGKKIVSRVLPRDKLVGLLHQHIIENYADAHIDLLYGYDLEPESFGNEDDDIVTVRISKCDEAEEEDDDRTKNNNNEYIASQESDPLCDVDTLQTSTTKLLIAADGSARTVANAIERHDATQRAKLNPLLRPFAPKPFKVTRFVDDNARVYKSVPIALPADWPHDLNYSARQDRLTLEALPSNDRGNLCALLLMKPEEEFAQADASAEALRAYFDENMPQFSALIDEKEMAALAKKPASTLPAFRFAGPRLNCEKRTLVLGDAAHTVKPYYGLGANTALEDVQMLSDALDDASTTTASSGDGVDVDDEAVVPTAVQLFSDRRSADSAALVTMSRNMDRPGKLFFLCFLAPLILDGIFHKLAPKIFDPNMFAMFQRQDITFWKIQRKKRLDRVLQILSIGTLLTGAGVGVKAGVHLLARVVGRSQGFVSIVMAGVAAIGVILRRKLATSAS